MRESLSVPPPAHSRTSRSNDYKEYAAVEPFRPDPVRSAVDCSLLRISLNVWGSLGWCSQLTWFTLSSWWEERAVSTLPVRHNHLPVLLSTWLELNHSWLVKLASHNSHQIYCIFYWHSLWSQIRYLLLVKDLDCKTRAVLNSALDWIWNAVLGKNQKITWLILWQP